MTDTNTKKTEARQTDKSKDSLMRLIDTFKLIGLPYEQEITAAYMQGFNSGRDMGIVIGKMQAKKDAGAVTA